MKRSIIFTVLAAAAVGGALTSCEDMLKTESTVVMFDSENTLDAATDTVYSVMGIVQKLQTVADRTLLLGELRGDLVSLTDNALQDLKDISSFDVDLENPYNNPVDYYAIINNCNFFLANADTAYKRNEQYIFQREWVAVLAYRAWTYLQMAQIYGKVPYVTEPIVSGDKAVADDYEWLDIKELAKRLIPDLEPYVDLAYPQYGTLGETFSSDNIFIPVRVILGDLCLWAGEYEKAAVYYHDYLSSLKRQVYTNTYRAYWASTDWVNVNSTYTNMFSSAINNQMVTCIPLEEEEYDGIVSELPEIFNSTEDNKYYFMATYSKALANLSAAQVYCHVDINQNTFIRTTYYVDPTSIENTLLKGDLRLYDYFKVNTDLDEDLLSSYNTKEQTVSKILDDRVVIYRNDQIYLRYAEALNRAGFPESAFCILKYGLCQDNITLYVSQDEIDRASSLGILSFNPNQFRPYRTQIAAGALVTSGNTMGLHQRGSGDATANEYYLIPSIDTTATEYASMTSEQKMTALREYRIDKVEELIADEMALELAFEGYRFGDLMRISFHRGEAQGKYSDNAFLADHIAERDGTVDATLQSKLTGDGYSYNKNWFLPMP